MNKLTIPVNTFFYSEAYKKPIENKLIDIRGGTRYKQVIVKWEDGKFYKATIWSNPYAYESTFDMEEFVELTPVIETTKIVTTWVTTEEYVDVEKIAEQLELASSFAEDCRQRLGVISGQLCTEDDQTMEDTKAMQIQVTSGETNDIQRT